MNATAHVSAYASSLRRAFLIGFAALILFCGVIGYWAFAAPLAGAVLAPGQFVVDSNVKKVQHQTGGIVSALLVREGQRVGAGELLLRLDETLTRSSLQIVAKQLDEAMARQARLEAERAGQTDIVLPPELAQRASLPDVAKSIEDERRLLETRRSQREGMRRQLEQRIVQLREEILGVEAQVAARQDQINLLARELDGLRDLFRRNLVPMTRIMPLEREAASLTGQKGQLLAARAQAEGKISEINLQLLQIGIDMQTEIGKELRELQPRIAELGERRIAAEDQLRRMELRAPIDGYVHQLAVHTVGGVVSPAEPVMLIVPQDEELQIEVKINPTEIDQLHLGQKATIKVHAGNPRTTPELTGEVARIAADVTREPQTGLTYYLVRLTLPRSELARLGDLRMIPGMQAEGQIQTAERTLLQYILRPLKDQFDRAFKER